MLIPSLHHSEVLSLENSGLHWPSARVCAASPLLRLGRHIGLPQPEGRECTCETSHCWVVEGRDSSHPQTEKEWASQHGQCCVAISSEWKHSLVKEETKYINLRKARKHKRPRKIIKVTRFTRILYKVIKGMNNCCERIGFSAVSCKLGRKLYGTFV